MILLKNVIYLIYGFHLDASRAAPQTRMVKQDAIEVVPVVKHLYSEITFQYPCTYKTYTIIYFFSDTV